jgi:hypothetical protein
LTRYLDIAKNFLSKGDFSSAHLIHSAISHFSIARHSFRDELHLTVWNSFNNTFLRSKFDFYECQEVYKSVEDALNSLSLSVSWHILLKFGVLVHHLSHEKSYFCKIKNKHHFAD